MSVEQSLPEVNSNFMQDCPLCGRSNRIVVKGVYRSEVNEGQQYPDMGYSFCNCKDIFYTDPKNIRYDPFNMDRLKSDLDALEDGFRICIYVPDTFFVDWETNPYSFEHWDVRTNEILWNMDTFAEEIKGMGFEIVHIARNFQVGTKHPQTFLVMIKKQGDYVEPPETEPRQATVAAKKHFGDKPIQAVEVGVLRGDNAQFILDSLNCEKLSLVDPWTIVWDYEDQDFQDGNMEFVIDRFHGYDNVDVIVSDSVTVAERFADESLDFVYIDADHLYEPVKADIAAWLPKIKKGGIISGHDYNYVVRPSVKEAVDEAFGDKVKFGKNQNVLEDWWVYI